MTAELKMIDEKLCESRRETIVTALDRQLEGINKQLSALCSKIDSKQELADAKLSSVREVINDLKESIVVAKNELQHRLAQMNEIRDQLVVWGKTFATADYVDGKFEKIDSQFENVSKEIRDVISDISALGSKTGEWQGIREGTSKWSHQIALTVLTIIAAVVSASMVLWIRG